MSSPSPADRKSSLRNLIRNMDRKENDTPLNRFLTTGHRSAGDISTEVPSIPGSATRKKKKGPGKAQKLKMKIYQTKIYMGIYFGKFYLFLPFILVAFWILGSILIGRYNKLINERMELLSEAEEEDEFWAQALLWHDSYLEQEHQYHEGEWSTIITEELDELGMFGMFIETTNEFRHWITPDGTSGFRAEPGRYHLYVSLACPWSHQTLIVLKLKGLEDVISYDVVDPLFHHKKGWILDEFATKPGTTNSSHFNCTTIQEIYDLDPGPEPEDRYTVPLLFDKRSKMVVNNNATEIMMILNEAFNALSIYADGYVDDVYPKEIARHIDNFTQWVDEEIVAKIHEAAYTINQQFRDDSLLDLFDSFADLDSLFKSRRYVFGKHITIADVYLYSFLIRFDQVYYPLFKCNKHHLDYYPNLDRYATDLYDIEAFWNTTDFWHIHEFYFNSLDRHPTVAPSKNKTVAMNVTLEPLNPAAVQIDRNIPPPNEFTPLTRDEFLEDLEGQAILDYYDEMVMRAAQEDQNRKLMIARKTETEDEHMKQREDFDDYEDIETHGPLMEDGTQPISDSSYAKYPKRANHTIEDESKETVKSEGQKSKVKEGEKDKNGNAEETSDDKDDAHEIDKEGEDEISAERIEFGPKREEERQSSEIEVIEEEDEDELDVLDEEEEEKLSMEEEVRQMLKQKDEAEEKNKSVSQRRARVKQLQQEAENQHKQGKPENEEKEISTKRKEPKKKEKGVENVEQEEKEIPTEEENQVNEREEEDSRGEIKDLQDLTGAEKRIPIRRRSNEEEEQVFQEEESTDSIADDKDSLDIWEKKEARKKAQKGVSQKKKAEADEDNSNEGESNKGESERDESEKDESETDESKEGESNEGKSNEDETNEDISEENNKIVSHEEVEEKQVKSNPTKSPDIEKQESQLDEEDYDDYDDYEEDYKGENKHPNEVENMDNKDEVSSESQDESQDETKVGPMKKDRAVENKSQEEEETMETPRKRASLKSKMNDAPASEKPLVDGKVSLLVQKNRDNLRLIYEYGNSHGTQETADVTVPPSRFGKATEHIKKKLQTMLDDIHKVEEERYVQLKNIKAPHESKNKLNMNDDVEEENFAPTENANKRKVNVPNAGQEEESYQEEFEDEIESQQTLGEEEQLLPTENANKRKVKLLRDDVPNAVQEEESYQEEFEDEIESQQTFGEEKDEDLVEDEEERFNRVMERERNENKNVERKVAGPKIVQTEEEWIEKLSTEEEELQQIVSDQQESLMIYTVPKEEDVDYIIPLDDYENLEDQQESLMIHTVPKEEDVDYIIPLDDYENLEDNEDLCDNESEDDIVYPSDDEEELIVGEEEGRVEEMDVEQEFIMKFGS